MGEEQQPKRLEYVRIPPPPGQQGPPVFLSIAVGTLPLVLGALVYFAPGRSDPDFIGFSYVLRGVIVAWVGSVWGLIWSIRESRRRAAAWRDAQVSYHGESGPHLMESRRNDP